MSKKPGSGQLVVGGCIVGALLLLGMFPDLVTKRDPNQVLGQPLLKPSARFWLGTDEVGRDILSRVVHGGQTEMLVSLSAALLASAIGTICGIAAGYFRGFIDATISHLVTVLLAFPALVLALFLISVWGRGSLVQLLAIAVVSAPSMVRLCRGVTLSLRTRPYVEASRLAGANAFYVARRHLLPNAAPTIVVGTSVLAANALLTAAALSYLGLGIQPPDPSWGNLLKASYGVAFESPWYGVAPGACITLVAFGYTLLGNGLRLRLMSSDAPVGMKSVHV